MKQFTHAVLILALCGLAGLALSSCKKKGPKTATARIATNIADVRARVHATIESDIRKKNVLMLLNEIDSTREQLVLRFIEAQQKVHKNPEMPREEYEALMREFATIRSNAAKKIAAARITLRTYVTKQEWQILFAQQKKKKEDPTGLDRYKKKKKAKTAADGTPDEAAETTTPGSTPEPTESEVSP